MFAHIKTRQQMVAKDPEPGVLVKVSGKTITDDRWCRRIILADGSIYSYVDILTDHVYPPVACIEIREGTVQVGVTEVKT